MKGITDFHAKYFAYELTRKLPANDVGKLTASLQDAQVDLNPHQVEAALFAFKSPLSKGAVLADEVGLGKTIEAGIILSQKWAERKRKLLIIGPSNLRKQWTVELAEKFFLPSSILESKSFNQQIKEGNLNPFEQKDNILICSFHFARNKSSYLRLIDWDLVIIDEAHRLRNVYKPNNKIANAIKDALIHSKKVLLTATPLQNSILELYGLISLIDPYVFGDLKSFKSQYRNIAIEENYESLRRRLQPVCKRTLRRQVLEYIRYTKRIPIIEEYFPGEDEMQLYDWVSEYLQRPVLYALPTSQRHLMTLILRKLLASSSYAIFGTLDALVHKLASYLIPATVHQSDLFASDFETYREVEEEWDSDEVKKEEESHFSDHELEEIRKEKEDLERFRSLAKSIESNSKTEHLITALDRGFQKLQEIGANKKALIFTESRRTQDFLCDFLEARGYTNQVLRFNGSNNDPKSKEIYKEYVKKYQNTDVLTGSRTSDIRAAIIEAFKNDATILVATEAAAEGINLQFCSLVVNFDLPWNPQRIEQRIGRCHRYGQKHDVVVINFLNKRNAADQRVYELLDQKFKLFNGVFGASDEVLGSIGNGLDFEKRIAKIYNDCRSEAEIKKAFDDLQDELRPEISEKVQKTRQVLLENFDQEVTEKLRTNLALSKDALNKFEVRLWAITKHFLADFAQFDEQDFAFSLTHNPFPSEIIHPGPYLILRPKEGQRKSDIIIPNDTNIYRVGHPLARRILKACQDYNTPTQKLIFDYSNTSTKITSLEPFIGQSGWLSVEYVTIQSFEEEDHLIIACITDDGQMIDAKLAQRFFSLNARLDGDIGLPESVYHQIKNSFLAERQEIIGENAIRNNDFFEIEMAKLDNWADDMKMSLDKEIKDLDAEIKLRKSEAKKMMMLENKINAQRAIKQLERKRRNKRRDLYMAQDEIEVKKDILLESVEKRLKQTIQEKHLFTIKWVMI